MGRLTVRNFENEACCTHGGCDAYEDCYECPGFQDILAKLAHYEDLEESGRLVILPCEVGDYIYDISEFTDGNEHPEMIVVRAYYIELSLDADGEINYCIAGYDYKKEDFGKTVFRTIEEAEAALKGGGQDE